MASPQLENGHIRIANEILEALCRVCLRGGTRQVLDVILRKTYGFNKKEDAIALSQFVELTGLSKRSVIYALQELEAKRMIVIEKSPQTTNIIRFNKDYESWVVQNSSPQVKMNRDRAKLASAKLRTGAKLRKKVVQNYVKKVKSFAHTKDINTITKDIQQAASAARFNQLGVEIIKAFENIDPKNKTYYGNTTQRTACDFLIAEYGLSDVMKRIAVLPKTNKIPYFPTITTPHQLKEKWVQLQDAVARKRGEIESKKPNIV